MTKTTPPKDAFRMPNSLVQGFVTPTSALVNKLTACETVTTAGVISLIPTSDPTAEVRTSIAEILSILEVSKDVSQAVYREWRRKDGSTGRKTYKGRRCSPAATERVREALLRLFDQQVCIVKPATEKTPRTERLVHVLDSFGFAYEKSGQKVDLLSPPAGYEVVDVSTDGRRLRRLRRKGGPDGKFEKATGVVFRLNRELAIELSGAKGTIKFTLFSRKLFGLLRRYMKQPSAIRLIFLILRQVSAEFQRPLDSQLSALGWDMSHPTRSIGKCEKTLGELQELGIVESFKVDPVKDRLWVRQNKRWYLKFD